MEGPFVNRRFGCLFAVLLGLVCTFAAHGDSIFVTNYLEGTISEYDSSGATVNASLVTGLTKPYGIAVSGSDLFVTNQATGTIGEYTTSGVTVNASLVAGLVGPTAIVVSGPDLFVTSVGQRGEIGEYTTSGATVNASLVVTEAIDYNGIAVSGSDLLVTEEYGGAIQEYSALDSSYIEPLVLGLTNPVGIVVSGSDLYVANAGAGAIDEHATSSSSSSMPPFPLVSGLSNPVGIAMSGSDLFVLNAGIGAPGAGSIGEYTTSGATVNGSLVTGLYDPYGIAIAASTPEPDTFMLLGLGAVILEFLRRKRVLA